MQCRSKRSVEELRKKKYGNNFTICALNLCRTFTEGETLCRSHVCLSDLLRCLLEWLQSIVLSTSVCVHVCLSVSEDISRTTSAIFTKFCVHVAYGCGSVLCQGDKIPKGRGSFGGFRLNGGTCKRHRMIAQGF